MDHFMVHIPLLNFRERLEFNFSPQEEGLTQLFQMTLWSLQVYETLSHTQQHEMQVTVHHNKNNK